MRTAKINRKTKETRINVKVNLDGKGASDINTPNGFLTHMLELLAKYSLIDMEIDAKGDTQVDLHHTVEDTGITLGKALDKALSDRRGIERYGWAMMVMDEVRCDVAIDIGGRPNLVYGVRFAGFDRKTGFDFSLIKEFMKALSDNLKATIHITRVKHSKDDNNHHIAEAVFKGLARALRQAVKITGEDIPSTKGTI